MQAREFFLKIKPLSTFLNEDIITMHGVIFEFVLFPVTPYGQVDSE